MLQYWPAGLPCPEKVQRQWGATVYSYGALSPRKSRERTKRCGTCMQECPVQRNHRDSRALLHTQVWLPSPRKVRSWRDFAVLIYLAAVQNEKGATVCRPCRSNIQLWAGRQGWRKGGGFLWSERSVAECTRSCTARGNRASRVLRCVHTGLPQGGRRELVGPE